MPTPLFTSDSGKQASEKANEARRKKVGLTKWLARVGLKETETAKVFELLQTAVATPVGTFLAGWFLIDILDRAGYFHKSGTSTPGANNPPTSTNPIQSFLSSITSNSGFGAGAGVGALYSQLFASGGASGGGNVLNQILAGGSSDAVLLKAGIFSISMVQALGGGQGINSLLAPLLTAATKA